MDKVNYAFMTTEELEEIVKSDSTNIGAWDVLIQRKAKELCGGEIPLNYLFVDERHIQENLTEKEDVDEYFEEDCNEREN